MIPSFKSPSAWSVAFVVIAIAVVRALGRFSKAVDVVNGGDVRCYAPRERIAHLHGGP